MNSMTLSSVVRSKAKITDSWVVFSVMVTENLINLKLLFVKFVSCLILFDFLIILLFAFLCFYRHNLSLLARNLGQPPSMIFHFCFVVFC